MSEHSVQNKVGVVILAAGKGKRMQSDLPKLMHLLKGKPLIDYPVRVIEELIIKPVVVVNDASALIQDYLRDRAEYAIQKEQLGTGHAVMVAEGLLKNNVEHVVVLYGDMPSLTTHSLQTLIDTHILQQNCITMMVVNIPDFKDWRQYFYDWGRIVRNTEGSILKIVEKKDCFPVQLNILEVNPGVYCFNSDWLWENLKKLNNDNNQKEYYLTDLIEMCIEQRKKLGDIATDPKETVGINTKEQLNLAATLI